MLACSLLRVKTMIKSNLEKKGFHFHHSPSRRETKAATEAETMEELCLLAAPHGCFLTPFRTSCPVVAPPSVRWALLRWSSCKWVGLILAVRSGCLALLPWGLGQSPVLWHGVGGQSTVALLRATREQKAQEGARNQCPVEG